MSLLRGRIRDEQGAVLIAGLLLVVALLMVVGAAVDIGNAFIVRGRLVSLADQAALAGSQALDMNELQQGTLALDPEQARADALQSIADQPGLQVTASATTGAVEVNVSETVPTVLLRLVGLSELHLSARAAGAPTLP